MGVSDVIEPKESSATHSAEANRDVLPGYKRTEAGVIPDDWIVSSVGSEFKVQLGKMLDAARNIGIRRPYIGNRSVQWGRFDLQDLAEVPMTPADLKRFRLRRNDLLVCEGGEIGRAAVWNDAIPECYYQKALHRLRPKKGYDVFLMMSFLYMWASSGYLGNYVTQTSIAHLPKDKLEVVPLPVPSPAEQRAIAESLADMDQSLTALEALIAKKRAIKQATMQQLLTGKTRLLGFSGEWKSATMAQIGSIYGGLSGKSKADFGMGSAQYVPFLNVLENVTVDSSQLDWVYVGPGESQNRVLSGDLLFNGTSETPEDLAMCSVVEESIPNLYLNSFCFGFRIEDRRKYDGLFLAYFFRGTPGRDLVYALAQGATRHNLSKTQFLALETSMPEPNEQRGIARVLSDMDAEISAVEARRDKTRSIKQGMIQHLLTGQIRLVKPQASESNS